jgi:hypothetical protein
MKTRKDIVKITQVKINHDQWQSDFLAAEGDKILYCGRQIGKSTICAEDCGEYVKDKINEVILMIAPIERQAFALFEKTLSYLLDNYPKLIKTGKDKPTQTRIQLTNGCVIWCLPTGINGLGIRFLTVNRLYGEECSRIPNEVWTAVTPMLLTTGGATVLLTTPAGKGTYASDVWNNKGSAFGSFKRFSASSEDVMNNRTICETWTIQQREKALEHLAQEKARMSALFYAQEYLGKEIDELHQFFPTDLIKSCMFEKEILKAIPTETNYLGVDVARMGEDQTVLISGNKVNSELLVMTELEIHRKILLTETARLIKAKNLVYDYRKIFIDTTGMGFGVFDILLEDENTKRKVVSIENAQRSLDNDENHVKKILKEDLYNNLLCMMEQGKIKLFNDPEILISLISVQAEYDGGMLKIDGSDTHIAESLIRLAWSMKDKSLNIYYG